jgi:glycosyltransferase involved in cell wall biosynthesis
VPTGAGSPAVSVVVPCRNERDYITACVNSILAQVQPPGGIEIFVVDGMSEDGTRAILANLARTAPQLTVIDNPARITPCARNLGIGRAAGDFVAFLDAHAEFAPDYLLTCLALFAAHPAAWCTGGPIQSVGHTAFGRAVAAAMSHPLVIGNAKHRHPHYEGYAEGACFPVFRREIFGEIGLFDETLVRNQDDEFNYRVARHGGKVYISPQARCTYFVRETPTQLFRQYFQYGYWRVAVLRKHAQIHSYRHILPALFFAGLIMALLAGFFLAGFARLAFTLLPVIYLGSLVVVGGNVARQKGIITGLLFPLAAMTIHSAYAIGFWWRILVGHRKTHATAT